MMQQGNINPRILVVEDDVDQRHVLMDIIKSQGYHGDSAESIQEGLSLFLAKEHDLVLTDLRLPDGMGTDFLRRLKEIHADVCVAMITAYGSIDSAVSAMKAGAFDYIQKPFSRDEFINLLKEMSRNVQLIVSQQMARTQGKKPFHFFGMVGASHAMHENINLIKQVSRTNSTVIISGESGTGKELIAKAIHYNSQRRDRPMVVVNCASIPENLLESELFGHERGSFTGAVEQKKGLFEDADQSTLFLDEVGEMPLHMQAKLLRSLQEKEIKRVGGNKSIKINIRVIAATNKDLEKEVRKGAFREDLYYRLNVVPIHLPPLRNRIEDIPLLIQHFLEAKQNLAENRSVMIRPEAVRHLCKYPWPGNIRELESLIERIIVLSRNGIVEVQNLPENIRNLEHSSVHQSASPGAAGRITLVQMEISMLQDALRQAGGSIRKASNLLGITYKTMQYRIKKYHKQLREYLK